MNDGRLLRLAAVAAVVGALAQVAAGLLEPDWGGDPAEAIRVVADSSIWIGGRLLDLVYTNLISTLKVGAIRYGVMCGVDGMAIDDGTVMRLAEDRFLLTTTTGNAATILDWMEEWLQTEWPHLSVRLTSVTEQWATVALVGPRSRDVLARVAPELAVDNDAFPFMTWRDGAVAGLTLVPSRPKPTHAAKQALLASPACRSR